MYLRYGNYRHALDVASVSIGKTALLSDAKVPYGYKEVWRVNGFLQADTAAQLTTAIRNLTNAYSVHGQNAALLMNDGSASAHVLNSVASAGGVIVSEPPSFPVGNGAEYSTFRSYSITLEAEFGVDMPGNGNILEWNEQLSFAGGGPRHVLLELRNGPPQKQLVSQETVYYASQSGHAVGYANWPAPAAPIWPAHEDRPQRQIARTSPQTHGYGIFAIERNFEISWAYQFQSAAALNGRPTRKPF